MSLIRDRQDFGATIDAAASQLGIDARAVEKDYWVSEVLRVLARDFSNDFIFKGGTSLSKCHRIIERFSEDVDILILKRERTTNATHTLMKDMAKAAASALGAEFENVNSETGVHKTVRLAYSTERLPSPGISSGVKLEMGIRGGSNPHESLPAGCLLADAMTNRGVDISGWDDLQPVLVPVLHPGRTLLEKLSIVHTRLGSDPSAEACGQNARHYYDIHQLLGDDRVIALLESRQEVHEVLADIQSVTNDHFNNQEHAAPSAEIRPEAGWAASAAFNADNATLSSAYAKTMAEFYFGAEPAPDFVAVCARVHELRELL